MQVTAEEITIATGDERMPCHLAQPSAGGPYPALVVVMEAFGLNGHIKAITDRFAAEGLVALAPNLYFRHSDNVVSYDDLPGAMRLAGSLNDDQIVADMAAAVTFLKSARDAGPKAGVVGFCMGGRIAFLAACRIAELAVAAPFYGGGITTSRQPGVKPPIEYVDGLNAPVLAFFGGKDRFIPIAEVDKLRDRLKAAGKDAEVVFYPDADHGFMCDERPSFHPVRSKEAWARVIPFLKEHLG